MRSLGPTLFFVILTVTGWFVYQSRPKVLVLTPRADTPVCRVVDGRSLVTLPHAYLIAEVEEFHDELYSYLMFDYLRSSKQLQGTEVLLTYRRSGRGMSYQILLHLKNDLITAIPFLARLQNDGRINKFEWSYIPKATLFRYQGQTQIFVAAYNLPARRGLDHMSKGELVAYLRRFLLFKSVTDRRVQRRDASVPPGLSPEQAHQLATDIITVADFYRLPLDFFLGIGAMENNYMNVRGDLTATAWKRHPQRGDIVLKRRHRRVLVINDSSGVWQITRETLRYAHKLYLKDNRDYSLLPERLRPSKKLDLDEVNSEVLTTYAGLLFRNLLDRFHGDVVKAVGAYNGGPGRPNERYAEGVSLVAGYARRILEQAATLNGQSVPDMPFLAPRR